MRWRPIEDPEQKHEFALALLLLLMNALNLADLTFTYMALQAGYPEANPLMSSLFANLHPVTVGLIKLGFGAAFSVAAWIFRDRRGVTTAVGALLAIYFVLFAYHITVTLRLV